MKYTEKIGNGYLTYEAKDLKKYAPSSFLGFIGMVLGGVLLFFIFFGIFFLLCNVVGWFLELIF